MEECGWRGRPAREPRNLAKAPESSSTAAQVAAGTGRGSVALGNCPGFVAPFQSLRSSSPPISNPRQPIFVPPGTKIGSACWRWSGGRNEAERGIVSVCRGVRRSLSAHGHVAVGFGGIRAELAITNLCPRWDKDWLRVWAAVRGGNEAEGWDRAALPRCSAFPLCPRARCCGLRFYPL